ncbi:hypothetical protein [Natrinema sp. DC36]|nr:hypothetical protein [Natrinema sp. DC36]
MTIDTRIWMHRPRDTGNASATEPTGICAVFESSADSLRPDER